MTAPDEDLIREARELLDLDERSLDERSLDILLNRLAVTKIKSLADALERSNARWEELRMEFSGDASRMAWEVRRVMNAVEDRAAKERLQSEGTSLGVVKRGPKGWNGWTLDGKQVVSDYPGSRDTAAGNVAREQKEAQV